MVLNRPIENGFFRAVAGIGLRRNHRKAKPTARMPRADTRLERDPGGRLHGQPQTGIETLIPKFFCSVLGYGVIISPKKMSIDLRFLDRERREETISRRR